MTAISPWAYTAANPAPNLGYSPTAGGSMTKQGAVGNQVTNTLGGQHVDQADWFDTMVPILIAAEAAAITGGAAAAAMGPGLAGAAVGGAVGGTTSSAVSSSMAGKPITAGSLGKGALIGGVSGGLGYEATPLAASLNNTTGIGSTASTALVKGAIGAGTGALTGAVTGIGAAHGAEIGAVSGLISGAIKGSGAQGALSKEIGAPAAGLATGLAAGELTSLAGSTLTSPSGKSGSGSTGGASGGSSGLSPGVAPLAIGAGMAAAGSSTGGSSFLGDVGTGLSNSLGGGSLGTTLGGMAPYLAVGAIGLEQAKAGQAQDAKLSGQQQALAAPLIKQSNDLLGNYNKGVINPTDKATSQTEINQGTAMIAQAQGLSKIAQAAFADYSSGKLNQADQLQLDQNVAAQKQEVRQQLSAAGITDSTILAGQDQQIENNAIISKQNLLDQRFATGTKAYDEWLTTTQAGQATIQRGMEFASSSLQTELTNAMAAANIGINEVNAAISTQMTTDANYAAQVSQLMGTLATAYAKSVAGSASGGGGGGGSGGGGVGGLLSAAASKGIASGSTGNTGGVSGASANSAVSDASLPSDISLSTSDATLGTNSIGMQNSSFFSDPNNFTSSLGNVTGP